MPLRVGAAVLLVFNVAAIVLAPGSLAGYSEWLIVFQIAASALMLLAAAAAAWQARRVIPANRSAWPLLVVTAFCSLAANALMAYFEVTFGGLPIYPGPSDVLLLLAYVPLCGALYRFARQMDPAQRLFSPPARRYLAPGAATLFFLILWAPLFFTTIPVAEKVTAAIILMLDILLIQVIRFVYVTAIAGRPQAWSSPGVWLCAGSGLILLTDASFAFTSQKAIFNPTPELLWLLASTAWTWAALLSISTARSLK